MAISRAQSRVQIDPQWLRAFSERYHIRKLWLYGSVLGDGFRPDSDIDVLVDYDPAHVPSLFTLGGMAADLEDALGREVDLKTPGFMPDAMLARVLETAELLYDAQ